MLNREIMFRGQTQRYGEKVRVSDGQKIPGRWAYGGIFPGTGDFSVIYGWYNGEDQTGANLKKLPVYSDTVGQYTGLHNRNSVRVFEGDIIKTRHGIRVISFKPGGFFADKPNSRLSAPLAPYWKEIDGDAEIIGNIHDNPELLQEEGGGPG